MVFNFKYLTMNILDIILIIVNFAGALAVFLFGMKLMSEGLQKIAGSKMREILGKITNNPFRGILIGIVVTVAVQSSSATTVMVVSFVSAGLLSLSGAIAVIMGANIGTTVTAWIITLLGLGESSGNFSLPMLLAAVALIFMFSKKDKSKSLGEFIIGLGLLLVGMDFLQSAMPNLEEYPSFLELLARMSDLGFWSIIIFVIIGALLTCLVQASAAMMAITLVMCYKGWIGFDVAVALVMGQNIGTTITANLAAMVANTAGKKSARAHLVFNVLGVVFTLIVFSPLMKLIANLTELMMGSNPYTQVGEAGYSPETIPLALSLFHTFFNVVNTLILVWFIPQIMKIVEWMVKPSAEDMEDTFRLTYISGNMVNTSELNIESAHKEIENFSKRILRMYDFLPTLIHPANKEEFDKVFERVEKYEAITDRMELEIAKFLTKIGRNGLSDEGSKQISSMLRIIDNLESIGDAIYQIAIIRKTKHADNVHFLQDMNNNISHMNELVRKALVIMDENLHNQYDKIDISGAYAAENDVNIFRNQLRKQHLDDLKAGAYDYTAGTVYSGLYALYEKLADYVINVSEAACEIKKDKEAISL